MVEYASIRVTPDVKEQAEQAKREDETWNDYVLRCSENPPEVQELVEATSLKNEISMAADPTVEVDVEKIITEIERLESAVKEATQAAQSADKKLEDLQ